MLPIGLGKFFKSAKISVGSKLMAFCCDGGIKFPIVVQPVKVSNIIVISSLYIIQTSVLR